MYYLYNHNVVILESSLTAFKIKYKPLYKMKMCHLKNMPLYHKNYFDVKTLKIQYMREGLLHNFFFWLKKEKKNPSLEALTNQGKLTSQEARTAPHQVTVTNEHLSQPSSQVSFIFSKNQGPSCPSLLLI